MKRTTCYSNDKRRYWHIDEMKKDTIRMLPIILVIAIFVGGCSLILGGVCWLRLATGIPCPGCGLTRAAWLLVTGHPMQSIAMHPILLPMISAVLLYIYEGYYYSDENGPSTVIATRYAIVICILAIILYAVRMYMLFPSKEPYIYYERNLLAYIRKIFAH